MLEAIENQFLLSLTHLRKSTSLYMVLDEVGRLPLEITVKSRMVDFWSKILLINNLNYLVFYIEKLIDTPNFNSKWVTKVIQILDECGISEIWISQMPTPNLSKIVAETLKNQFYQKWNSDLNKSSKGRNYGIFKEFVKTVAQILHFTRKIPYG